MIETFKENFNYAKNNYSKARFVYNYIALPVFVAFSVIDLVSAILLVAVNMHKNFIASVVLFALLVIASIVMVSFLPYVKKKDEEKNIKEIKEFFDSELLKKPETEYFLPRGNSAGGVVKLIFEKDGYKIDDLKYSYDGFECALYTSNYLYKVNLIIVFKRNDVGNVQDGENIGVVEFSLPLDINLLSLMSKHNIKIVNPDVLTFIRNNNEEAVKQILKYGKVQDKFYDVK